MSAHPKYTLRLSLDASQCSRVDTGLKNLKLLSRRIHTLLTAHATELQILQRLYYKNKNQHCGSLFWRKVVEVRRYSERLEQHKPHILIDDLRCTFYGPNAHNTSSLKGPWTHFPDADYISSISDKIKNSVRLLEKTSQICISAFMSFHRSMQSAAFLPILLMFIAISSRMRVLCLELQTVLEQAVSAVVSLLPTAMHTAVPTTTLGQKDVTAAPLETNLSGQGENAQHDAIPLPSRQRVQQGNSPHIIVERKMPTERKDSSRPKATPKRKRGKITRNDIDDIFGS